MEESPLVEYYVLQIHRSHPAVHPQAICAAPPYPTLHCYALSSCSPSAGNVVIANAIAFLSSVLLSQPFHRHALWSMGVLFVAVFWLPMVSCPSVSSVLWLAFRFFAPPA